MNHTKANTIANHLRSAYDFTPQTTISRMSEIFSAAKDTDDLAEALWDEWEGWSKRRLSDDREDELTFEEWLTVARQSEVSTANN